MNPYELHRIQLALEGKTVVNSDELVAAPADEPDHIPRVLISDLGGEVLVRIRHDLPTELKAAVRRHRPQWLLDEPKLVEAPLQEHAPATLHSQRSYTIPAGHPLPDAADVTRVHGPEEARLLTGFFDQGFFAYVEHRRPAFAALLDGIPVSVCVSSRENEHAGESWVATDPAHRRRGFGRVAVAAWAIELHRMGKVAFYSHQEWNLGSASVARTLDLPQWCRQVVWE